MKGPLNFSNIRACIPSPLSIEPHNLHMRGQRPFILSHSGAGEASPRKTRPFAPLKVARLMPMLLESDRYIGLFKPPGAPVTRCAGAARQHVSAGLGPSAR